MYVNMQLYVAIMDVLFNGLLTELLAILHNYVALPTALQVIIEGGLLVAMVVSSLLVL